MPLKPVFWGRLVMSPHREPAPRVQCSACRGGGEINGLWCRECHGAGFHEAASTPRPRTAPEDIAY